MRRSLARAPSGCRRLSGAGTPPGQIRGTPCHLLKINPPAELRMRALHVRQLAEHFEHDEMRERLQAFAAELDAQADAIEVAAEDGE